MFFRLYFDVIKPVSNLQFYHGIYFSAMLRDWIRPYSSLPLAELGISPIPLTNGVCELYTGEKVALDISCPPSSAPLIEAMLKNELSGNSKAIYSQRHTHFVPGKSLTLDSYKILNETPISLFSETIDRELDIIKSKDEIDIIFHTPLRMKPALKEKSPFRYLDPIHIDPEIFFSAFCREMNLNIDSKSYPDITHKGFLWMDMKYQKSLGGIIGGMRIKSPSDTELLRHLIWGQYSGIGKNRAFGFGHYFIKEANNFRSTSEKDICNLIFNRTYKLSNVRSALEELKSSSPGPDHLAKEDLKEAGRPYLENIQKTLRLKKTEAGDTLTFRKRTRSGGYRLIRIANISERHTLLCILRQISPILDTLLLPSCFSYRTGRDYHMAARELKKHYTKGFEHAIKADISAFFDSIPQKMLHLLLNGLFYHDQITTLISDNILASKNGLPQGNPLSPILSNLFLQPFDHYIKSKGWHLIRYADDFCIVSNDKGEKLSLVELQKILNKIKLELSIDKSFVFKVNNPIDFCGYKVGQHEFYKIKRKPVEDESMLGIPAFQHDLIRGKPLYLSFRDSYTYLDNNNICIKSGEESKRYSMKEVSRIIIMGKPRVSAGLIQQAIIREKPVSFISIMGKPLGGFYIHKKMVSPQNAFNPIVNDWDAFCVDFTRSLVASKIHNQRMVLKQHKINEPRLKEIELSLSSCDNKDSLRGKEGAASAMYWAHFRNLVAPLRFPGRSYRPPDGPVNSLLSIGYSILYHRMAESISASGLNPWEGIYHSPRGSHMALASDLIEQYRFLVDRMVLALIHTKQISNDDFIENLYNKYKRLSSTAMKKFIHRYELTMRTEITIGEKKQSWAITIDQAPGKLLQSLRLGISHRAFRLP